MAVTVVNAFNTSYVNAYGSLRQHCQGLLPNVSTLPANASTDGQCEYVYNAVAAVAKNAIPIGDLATSAAAADVKLEDVHNAVTIAYAKSADAAQPQVTVRSLFTVTI